MYFLILILFVFVSNSGWSQKRSVFELPGVLETEISITDWALNISKAYDSTINIDDERKKLNSASDEIRRMIAGRKRDIDKFLAIRAYLYEPGEWNNYKPFEYDLDDPFGNELRNQLLTSILTTRKGNCVSMPTLFLVLAELVDSSLDVKGMHAPLHLMVRFNDRQSRDSWNVETTNGGNPARNQFIIESLKISQKALDSGIYLKELTKKEYISFLVTILASREYQIGNYQEAIRYLDLVLLLYPKNIAAIVKKASCLAWLGHTYEKQLSENNEPLTDIDHDILEMYYTESKELIDKALELGWTKPDKKRDEEYIKVIEKERDARK